MPSSPDWSQGTCHARPELNHLFYSDRKDEQDQAREMCWSCPIADECLTYAIDTGEKFGMWGGLLYAERRRLIR